MVRRIRQGLLIILPFISVFLIQGYNSVALSHPTNIHTDNSPNSIKQQYVEVQWNITFGEPDVRNIFYSLIQTTDGGFAIAGTTTIHGEYYDETIMLLVKTDINGQQEWNITLGNLSKNMGFRSLIQTSDNGFFLAGTTTRGGLLVKTDAYGQQEWNKTYGAGGSEIYSLIQTSDGGFAFAGITDFNIRDIWLVKIDSNGQHEWNKTFGGEIVYEFIEPNIYLEVPGYEAAYSLIQTMDGGYALAGSITPPYYSEGFESDIICVKTSSTGQQEWNASIGGKNNDVCYSLIQTDDGDYILAGITNSYGAGGDDIWLVKISGNGQHRWNNTFGENRNDKCYSLIQTKDDGYALAGSINSFSDIWLIKTNDNGQHEWNITIDERDTDVCFSLIQTEDNGFALAGFTRNHLPDPSYWWYGLLVKITTETESPGFNLNLADIILPILGLGTILFLSAILVIIIRKQKMD